MAYLNRTEVHKNILAAVFRRNEAKALGLVEPLDRPFKFTHLRVFAGGVLRSRRYNAGYFVWIGRRKWVGVRDVFCIVRVGGAMCKAEVPKSNRNRLGLYLDGGMRAHLFQYLVCSAAPVARLRRLSDPALDIPIRSSYMLDPLYAK